MTAIQERQLIHPAIPDSTSSPLSMAFLIIFPHIQADTIQPEMYIVAKRRFPSIIVSNF